MLWFCVVEPRRHSGFAGVGRCLFAKRVVVKVAESKVDTFNLFVRPLLLIHQPPCGMALIYWVCRRECEFAMSKIQMAQNGRDGGQGMRSGLGGRAFLTPPPLSWRWSAPLLPWCFFKVEHLYSWSGAAGGRFFCACVVRHRSDLEEKELLQRKRCSAIFYNGVMVCVGGVGSLSGAAPPPCYPAISPFCFQCIF